MVMVRAIMAIRTVSAVIPVVVVEMMMVVAV